MGKKDTIEEAAQKGERSLRAVQQGTTNAKQEEHTRKAVELMSEAELLKVHEEICSREPPECQRTFHPRDFRAHVLNLVTRLEKKHIA